MKKGAEDSFDFSRVTGNKEESENNLDIYDAKLSLRKNVAPVPVQNMVRQRLVIRLEIISTTVKRMSQQFDIAFLPTIFYKF
jgi:hypothetical protein